MAGRTRVFVSRRIPEHGLNLLRPHCELEVWPGQLPPEPAVLREKIADCEGLVSLLTDRVDAALLQAAPRLRVVSNFAVGVNNVDLAAATECGVVVGNTPGVLTDATADIAVTLLLAAARRLIEAADDARSGRWKTWEPVGWLGQELAGRTLGIVGMGRIGQATARRLHFGWGMRVLYTARSAKPEPEAEFGAKRVDLNTLLRESDFVSLHTDLNPETRCLFGSEQFQRMKPSAVFVNTARGPVVDQKALADALQSGVIFAAGLDVTDPEPLPPEHELYQLRNCIVVPHVASATVQTRDEMARICAENLLAGLRGRPMISCVNPEAVGRRR